MPDPFVLLDFPGGRRFFPRPKKIIEARRPEDVAPALESLAGHTAVGFVAYEAGAVLDPRLDHLSITPAPDAPPLLWFGSFEEEGQAFDMPDPAAAWLGEPKPLISKRSFRVAISTIHEHILAGDIYQANFTFQAEVAVAGHPLAIYEQVKERAQAKWGAVVFTGSHWILSCSPELFFTLADRGIVARPMKGTAPAGSAPEVLLTDEKQRAENLMIVDLMRNDLSRVSETGTVKVPELFAIEQFPTVTQMTSTITGRVREGVGPIDVLRTIFPCGSVTGAPKVRAMEIIDGLEANSRGPYTGSIGIVSGEGAEFNVAIRTLVLAEGSNVASLGLGSGVVADSDVESEWNECIAKGRFVASPFDFELIETMRVSAGDVSLLDFHLDRLGGSAKTLHFNFDREAVSAAIRETAGGAAEDFRLKLSLARDGEVLFDSQPLPDLPIRPDVRIMPRLFNRDDFRSRHKTSLREIYDVPLREAGSFEILFVDPSGFLTEGSFTNIFMVKDGALVTPPLTRGLLSGVMRRHLLESGKAVEGDIHVEGLSGHLFVGNAVRGLIKVDLET